LKKTDNYIDVSNVTPKKTYNVIEFFAGAGGLALGLEKAGFSTVLLNEIDKQAAATLRKNRPDWKVVEEDIVTLAEKGITKQIDNNIEIDLISGGYPCQAFSYAGKGLGLEDARGTLFYPFAKIIEELKPKVFLAENVKGLVTHDNGKTLQTMINVYENLGYEVKYKILNALDYGVAQKRERIVIVGIRKDLIEKYNLEYKFPEPYKYKLTLRDILQNVPKSEITNYSEKKKEIMKLVPPGGCWRDLPDEVAKEYMGASYYSGGGKTGMARRLSWDEPGLTVLCSPSQKQTERCHPEEVRPFTVRENARIQSFPDEWEFVGSISAKYKQIGNAVPVNFAEAIGKSIVKILNQID
jgi:DNA (cytosine-5)-methyltransferase 1